MGTGSGFGKTILIGDQFVLDGVPAIVAALPYMTEAIVHRRQTGAGWLLEDNRLEVPGYKESKREQQVQSINRILAVMGIEVNRHPIKIVFQGDLLAGSGVGASAATCVSLARALNQEFGCGLDDAAINLVAWEGEFAYHGTPSGVDNTASCFGGVMLYQLIGEQKRIEAIKLQNPIDIVLGNSGISVNTAAVGDVIAAECDRDPNVYRQRLDTITTQALEMKSALEKGDLVKVGALMNDNHRILIDMGLSHPQLVYLCNLANELGAWGAKLTGGGMGGYMLALTPGIELQERVAAAMEQEGYAVIRATIGG